MLDSGVMQELEVIHDADIAAVALEPIRSRLLAELSQPTSAATLSTRVGIPRQKVNYHLRRLEDAKLVHVSAERRWGGLVERLMVATATSYVVSPSVMGPVAADPARSADRLSASYAIALAARIVREVGLLLRRAQELGKRLATLSIDAEIRFRSAEDRADFSRDLTTAIAGLVARYHDESAPGGRRHRLIVAAHPKPDDTPPPEKP